MAVRIEPDPSLPAFVNDVGGAARAEQAVIVQTVGTASAPASTPTTEKAKESLLDAIKRLKEEQALMKVAKHDLQRQLKNACKRRQKAEKESSAAYRRRSHRGNPHEAKHRNGCRC